MSKKLGWLDKFVEEQAAKMEKTASLNKKAEQIIVDTDEIPGAEAGKEVTYKGAAYKVVDANYKDEIGVGIVLEKVATEVTAGVEDEIENKACEVCGNEPCTCETSVEEVPAEEPVAEEVPVDVTPVVEKKVTDAPERARNEVVDNYHIEVRDTVEVQKFEDEAAETANNIASENAVDGTTPEGKVNRILQRIQTPVAPVVEEAPVEEVEEAPVEEVPEVVESAAKEVVEEVVEEAQVEEEVSTEDEEKKEDKLANNRIFKKIIASLK